MNIQIVNKYFTPNRILDIGANVGQFYILCKNAYPYSFVFSIEAAPECEYYLSQLTKDYYICLLGKENKIVDFYVNKNDTTSTGNSIYKELTSFFSDDNLIIQKRECVMLDNLFEENSEFDLIKIDTQGSELDIMMGGKNLINKAKGIILEVSITPYNEGAPLHDEVIKYMDEIGFYPVEILEEHYLHGSLLQKDYLFIKKQNTNDI
jgi:FkbM family methyltransferase